MVRIWDCLTKDVGFLIILPNIFLQTRSKLWGSVGKITDPVVFLETLWWISPHPFFFKADVHEILIGTQGFSKNTKQWLLGFGQQGASFLMAAQCSKEVPSASLACAAVPGSEIHDQFLGKNRGAAQKNEMYKQSHMINIAIIIQDIICIYIYTAIYRYNYVKRDNDSRLYRDQSWFEHKLGLNTNSLKISQFSEIPKPHGPQALPCSSTCQKCGNSSSKPLRRSNLPRSALDSWAMGPKNGKLVVGIPTPLKNMSSSDWIIIPMFQTTNQESWISRFTVSFQQASWASCQFEEIGSLKLRLPKEAPQWCDQQAVGKFEHHLDSLWLPMVPWEVLPSITILELGMASSPMSFKPV